MKQFKPLIEKDFEKLTYDSRRLRNRLIEIASRKGGHFGGSFSCIDFLLYLYKHVLTINKSNSQYDLRDRFILSKGHSVLALYAVLEDLQLICNDDLEQYLDYNSRLAGHAEHFHIPWIEMSTGSLGHGASSGVGMALAAKFKNKNWNVFVMVGDGELNEGSNWEAIMFAAQHNLSNFILLIDNNGMESLSRTDEILSIEPLESKLKSFGFVVFTCDGHKFDEISRAFESIRISGGVKPFAIIFNTIKGKGVSFMSNNAQWHYRELKDSEKQVALKELTD